MALESCTSPPPRPGGPEWPGLRASSGLENSSAPSPQDSQFLLPLLQMGVEPRSPGPTSGSARQMSGMQPSTVPLHAAGATGELASLSLLLAGSA